MLTLPWLWPFTFGPSANVAPLLVAWACLAVALPLWLADEEPAGLLGGLLPAVCVVAASITAVIGLAQWFGVAPQAGWISPARIGEAYGNLRQRNQFASLMGLGLVGLLALVGRVSRPVLWAAALLLAMGNAASASRTGLLQWVLLAALMVVWPGPRRERLVLCGIALTAYALSSLLLPQLLWAWRGVEPFNVFERAVAELGCNSRKVLWSNVATLIAQRPWAGWGPGELDFAHYATLYPGPRFCDILDNAHNLPLHIAVEWGLPAAVASMGVVLFAAWRTRPWAEADPSRQAAFAVLGVVAVHSLLEYPLWYGPFQLVVVLACAVLAPGAAGWLRRRRAAMGAACAGVLVTLVAVGFDYLRVSQAYLPPDQRLAAYRTDPVQQAGRSVLFEPQLRFAELALTPVSRSSAARVHELAGAMLHYSPETMVIQKLIESALVLGRDDEVALHAERFRAAFPQQYEEFVHERGAGLNAPSR